MDIFETLAGDHQNVKALMERIEAAALVNRELRDALFMAMRTELLAHAKAEEQAFYAAIEDDPEVHERVLTARAEHALIENLLNEMLRMPPDDGEEWLAKFSVLRANFDHHVLEEEGELFQGARDILDAGESDEIAKKVLSREDALKSAHAAL